MRAWTASIAGAQLDAAASPPRRWSAAARCSWSTPQGVVHAFDAATGARRWAHSDRGRAATCANSAFGGGVSFFDGKVYATNGAGDVVALDAQTGAELWQVKPAGPLRGSPTSPSTRVYVMTQDNQIHALNTADGTPIWNEAAASGQPRACSASPRRPPGRAP